MTPFDKGWKSGITIPPSKKRRYAYKGLVPVERQPQAFVIIPRARMQADNDRRDALKRCIHSPEKQDD